MYVILVDIQLILFRTSILHKKTSHCAFYPDVAFKRCPQIVRIHGLKNVSIEDRYFTDGKLNKYNVLKWGVYTDRMENLYKVFKR